MRGSSPPPVIVASAIPTDVDRNSFDLFADDVEDEEISDHLPVDALAVDEAFATFEN